MPTSPTMEDIANDLGLAKITVSRALSGHPLVKDSTRKRVQDAAERLGYRLNVAARNLRQRKAQTIAVVIEMPPSHERSMSEPCPLCLLGGIMQELTLARQNMVLTTIELFHASPPLVDGIILIGQGQHGEAEKGIAHSGLPYVVWGAQHPSDAAPVVGSDNLAGGRLAASYLIDRGRRRLVFLGDVAHRENAVRLRGFRDRMKTCDGCELVRIAPCEFTFQAGQAAMTSLLTEHGQKFDGVFAASDTIALGALAAMRANGLQVPENVSIVGFDDAPAASHSSPPLTSVRQDWEIGGSLLARKILDLVAGRKVRSTVLPVSLATRSS